MDKLGVVFGGMLLVILIIFIGVLVGTLVGMLSGWIVGLFFTNVFHEVMIAFGLQPVALWKLGGFLGFVGGFFRTVNKKDDT